MSGVEEGEKPDHENETNEASELATRQVWSDEEWRQWNRSRWGSWGDWKKPVYWSASTRPESSSSQPAGHGTETTAAPSRPDPWTHGDPWQQPWQHPGGWNTSSSWWSSGGKGDYADPPSWAGWGNYRLWRRALRRWDGNTDVAVWRRAEKVLKSLDWELQSKLDHLSETTLASTSFLSEIFSVLDVLAGEKEDTEKRRRVRAALYEGARRNDESLAEYALRRDAQFENARRFMDIPEELKGIMLEEQAGLSRQGAQNLRTLTGGQHDYRQVRKALQVLDCEEESMIKGQKPSYLLDIEQAESEGDYEPDQDEEIFVALEYQDVDEYEAMNLLAELGSDRKRTWKENRLLKAAQKKDRRHFDQKDSRPPRSSTKRRLSIQELKKVTKCGNCGEKGHWHEECQKPHRPKGARPGGNAFVFLGSGGSEPASSGFFLASLLEVDGGNWAAGQNQFSFLQLPAGGAIIDPGASQDLIGLKSFERLQQKLASVGLRAVKLEQPPDPASGFGGQAKTLFNALTPCILGGKPGVIKLTVVEEDVPQLLSIGLLEHAKSVIDTDQNLIFFKSFGAQDQMNRLASGHRARCVLFEQSHSSHEANSTTTIGPS